jgi:hypothetical protein
MTTDTPSSKRALLNREIEPESYQRLRSSGAPASAVAYQTFQTAEMHSIAIGQIKRFLVIENLAAASGAQVTWNPLAMRLLPSVLGLTPHQAFSLFTGMTAAELPDRSSLFVPTGPIESRIGTSASLSARADCRDDLGLVGSKKLDKGG